MLLRTMAFDMLEFEIQRAILSSQKLVGSSNQLLSLVGILFRQSITGEPFSTTLQTTTPCHIVLQITNGPNFRHSNPIAALLLSLLPTSFRSLVNSSK